MISFDLECDGGHRFEGVFRDYESFEDQLAAGKISCPLCESSAVKRIYSGCAIQARPVTRLMKDPGARTFFDYMREFRRFVMENTEDVGRDFPEVARAIHYGLEEERLIRGETTLVEMKELGEEGIGVLPVPDVEKMEN
ncbi:MAG TPA: DUF1178 family protein [Spirochaetota bacterium]|nr:DUF1178 family protein [Spirochaetota bacterium]